jgi:hypothetical protein
MLPSVAAVLPCDKPISYEYRAAEKRFYIFDPTLGFVRSMSAERFFQNIVDAVECSRAHRPWNPQSAEVINLAEHQATRDSGRPSNQSPG